MPTDSQSVAVGEIGLGGEIRTINQIEKRVLEAKKLGFKRIVVPKNNLRHMKEMDGISLVGVETISQAMEELVG